MSRWGGDFDDIDWAIWGHERLKPQRPKCPTCSGSGYIGFGDPIMGQQPLVNCPTCTGTVDGPIDKTSRTYRQGLVDATEYLTRRDMAKQSVSTPEDVNETAHSVGIGNGNVNSFQAELRKELVGLIYDSGGTTGGQLVDVYLAAITAAVLRALPEREDINGVPMGWPGGWNAAIDQAEANIKGQHHAEG